MQRSFDVPVLEQHMSTLMETIQGVLCSPPLAHQYVNMIVLVHSGHVIFDAGSPLCHAAFKEHKLRLKEWLSQRQGEKVSLQVCTMQEAKENGLLDKYDHLKNPTHLVWVFRDAE